MTLNKLASVIAKHEGKKVETSIGNIREVMRIFLELYHSDEYSYSVIDFLNAEPKKKNKKKK
jgi:hypothetical protein